MEKANYPIISVKGSHIQITNALVVLLVKTVMIWVALETRE